MSVETLIGDVEAALVRLVQLGLGWRYPAVANLTALAGRSVAVLPDGSLVYVTDQSKLYEWRAFSTTAASSPTVIAPAAPPAGKTNGRWHVVATDWTWGAGGTNLAQKTSGYLKVVSAYSRDDGPEAILESVMAQTPGCVVQFQGDSVENLDQHPGSFYRCKLDFLMLITSRNLRGTTSGTQGPPSQLAEAATDPGAYSIIGDVRKLVMSNALALGVDGVASVRIGNARQELEDADQRVFVYSLGVTVHASFSLEDEDLIDPAPIRLQPALTEHWPAPTWDKDNYISSGGGFTEGPGPGAGLTRTIEQTIAKISGMATAAAELTGHTFTASKDTYRDLEFDGVWYFTEVAVGAPAPALASGRLRVAVTRTDAADIIGDQALCSFSIPYGSPIDL